MYATFCAPIFVVITHLFVCAESCTVPFVDHGELGKYAKRFIWSKFRHMAIYETVPIGTSLEENEKLILKCNANYFSKSQTFEDITLTCWKGKLTPAPECVRTRCDKSSLKYPGLVKSTGFLFNGESFKPNCHPGYEVSESSDKKIYCREGEWIGNLPPCSEARCDKSSLDYPGLVRSAGLLFNGESFNPNCHSGYEVAQSSDKKIYCDQGSWIGNLPPCTETRCDKSSLYYPGLVKSTGFLFNGESFKPACLPGYDVTEIPDKRIYCRQGHWFGNLPPCTAAFD